MGWSWIKILDKSGGIRYLSNTGFDTRAVLADMNLASGVKGTRLDFAFIYGI